MLEEKYQKEVIPNLKAKFGFKNDLEVPKISKVTINCGLGEIRLNPKLFKQVEKELSLICGQRPQVCKAQKAISGFKIREGDPVGFMVTLRGRRMYDFIEKLIHITLPRIRDFKGLNEKGFDGHGNYTLAIKEQTSFPEIQAENVERVYGLQITIVTTAGEDNLAKQLLSGLGLIFKGPTNRKD